MDAFREPTPEEAKMALIQFLGQTQGEVKELDKNIIGKTNTLRGNTLNVNQILGSLPAMHRAPVQQAPLQPAPSPQLFTSPPMPQAPAPAAVPASNNLLIDLLTKINTNIETVIKLLDK
jgi:hypothetical protein